MSHRRGALVCALLLLAALPASAHAAYFPGTPIAGPTSDLVDVSDVTVSRAGAGGGVVLMRDAGMAHVFVTRLIEGEFTPLDRLDNTVTTPATQPVIAGADGGRLIVAWVSGGSVLASVKASDTAPFSAPQVLGAGSDPAVDMSLNGAAYVSFTSPGGGGTDVRVARLPRDSTATIDVLPDAMDVDATRAAGDGDRRSRVATSADGTAVVTWGEAGGDGRTHVYARRLFGEKVSQAPQDLTLDALDGHAAAGNADLPDIDIEDDSSFAWVVFRQRFDDGHLHAVARRLVGSQFEAGTFVDGLGYPAASDVTEAVIQENGEGEGMAVTSGAGGVYSAVLHDNVFNPGVAVGTGATPASPSAGLGENGLGTIAWLGADGTAHVRPYKYVESSRAVPVPMPDALISDPAMGNVEPRLGMDLEVNRAGDAAALFAQTAGDGTRLMAAYFDRPPGFFQGQTSQKPRKGNRPTLSWGASFELWGKLTYDVQVDGASIGTVTDALKLVPPAPILDGRHAWKIVATDRRGQQAISSTRTLITDGTAPTLSFAIAKRKGRAIEVRTTARDGSTGSGIARVRIDFGDGTAVTASKATHGYGSGGRKSIRVSATDKAGNVVVSTRSVTLGK